MKYPKQQFRLLVECLVLLKPYVSFEHVSNSQLHYIIATQFNVHNKHNWLYDVNGKAVKDSKGRKIIDIEEKFDLYPDGCDDTHIETAMKKALKIVSNESTD